MRKHVFAGVFLAGILAYPAAAQMPDGYLDVFIAKVKMGKRVEFDAINKREAEINRKNKGDTWLAYGVLYGEPDTVYFTSVRANYGGAEEGLKAFEGSLTKVLGTAGMHKLGADFDATVESERSELRRRRRDLSANEPMSTDAYNNLVGSARFIRTAIVRVRPGRILDYERQLQLVKGEQERANPGIPSFVSQALAGQPATGVFYITNLLKSLADLDKIKPLQEVLGSSYATYQSKLAENILGTNIIIGRFLPELSNPPEEIVSVDPKFWRPASPPPVAKPTDEKR
ncbi:MAG TPA: hypothetical protein VMH81_19690 [Bryobacteraceae bacterium]|nr:hypothetical protein [Bryobacteraceae bacterium]